MLCIKIIGDVLLDPHCIDSSVISRCLIIRSVYGTCDTEMKVRGMVFFLSASENRCREVSERSIGINLKDCFFLEKKLVNN